MFILHRIVYLCLCSLPKLEIRMISWTINNRNIIWIDFWVNHESIKITQCHLQCLRILDSPMTMYLNKNVNCQLTMTPVWKIATLWHLGWSKFLIHTQKPMVPQPLNSIVELIFWPIDLEDIHLNFCYPLLINSLCYELQSVDPIQILKTRQI